MVRLQQLVFLLPHRVNWRWPTFTNRNLMTLLLIVVLDALVSTRTEVMLDILILILLSVLVLALCLIPLPLLHVVLPVVHLFVLISPPPDPLCFWKMVWMQKIFWSSQLLNCFLRRQLNVTNETFGWYQICFCALFVIHFSGLLDMWESFFSAFIGTNERMNEWMPFKRLTLVLHMHTCLHYMAQFDLVGLLLLVVMQWSWSSRINRLFVYLT